MTPKEILLPPHWELVGHTKRCSVCGYLIQDGPGQSADKIFAEHLRKAHQPCQTSEDANQAPARIVREATEK